MAEDAKVFRLGPEAWTGAFEDYIPSTGGGLAYKLGIDLAKSRDYGSERIDEFRRMAA